MSQRPGRPARRPRVNWTPWSAASARWSMPRESWIASTGRSACCSGRTKKSIAYSGRDGSGIDKCFARTCSVPPQDHRKKPCRVRTGGFAITGCSPPLVSYQWRRYLRRRQAETARRKVRPARRRAAVRRERAAAARVRRGRRSPVRPGAPRLRLPTRERRAAHPGPRRREPPLPAAGRQHPQRIRLLLKNRSRADSVIVAFAGHGVEFRGSSDHFFCPMDAALSDRQTLVSLGEVYKELEQCQAGFRLLLADACRNDPVVDHSRRVTAPGSERDSGSVTCCCGSTASPCGPS